MVIYPNVSKFGRIKGHNSTKITEPEEVSDMHNNVHLAIFTCVLFVVNLFSGVSEELQGQTYVTDRHN